MIPRAAIHAGLCLALTAAMPAGAVLGQADDTASDAGIGVLGADTVVLREPFDAEAAWMGIGRDETGENALSDGRLFSSYVVGPGNIWTDLELAAPAAVVRVEVVVDVDAAAGTAAGPACGSALGLPRYLVAGVNAGGWWLGRLIDGRLQVVTSGNQVGTGQPGEPVTVAIECAVVPDEGGDRVTMSVDGRTVATSFPVLEIPVGPYGNVALLVGTDDQAGAATFDDLVVSTGAAYGPAPVDRDADRPSE
jgi:hypothetical protein